MTKRIFRSICYASLGVLAACLVLIVGVLYNYFSEEQFSQLRQETELAAQGVEAEGMTYLDALDTDAVRITWIDSDGTVLYDNRSTAETMENHLERPEVQAALADGYGESKRYSSTLTEQSLYTAQLLTDGTVLRMSISQRTVFNLLMGMLQAILFIVLIALVLSVFLARRLAKKITKPLNEVNLERPLENEGYDEIAPLLRRIDSQQKQLAIRKNELQVKQDELDTIVGAMREGMILLGQRGRIISINPAAAQVLGTNRTCVGQDVLRVSRNPELQAAIQEARKGNQTAKTTIIHGRSYEINAGPVRKSEEYSKGEDFFGVAVIIVDVTEKEQAEQLRREFTANVSHELKTPLQSISGYSELMKCGMVKQEDMAPFAGKIYDEAQRLEQLVEDIIDLSHLDEGAADMPVETVDLYELGDEVLDRLKGAAEERNIILSLEGEAAPVTGIRRLLEEIVMNLCDNAVKYNRDGGRVRVSVENTDGGTKLTVADTGIGIPKEHQSRIFERFYRVDKSHSREIGGTGLGLSIVKHAAQIHHATIQLESEEGTGTTISVLFPAAWPEPAEEVHKTA